MIKIIFSDMDGTLLTGDKKLPPNFEEIILELKKRGVIFAPTSGRQYIAMVSYFENYADELLFIADGGSIVMRGDKEIYSNTLSWEDIKNIFSTTEKFPDILNIVCGKKSAYILKNFDTPKFTAGMMKFYNKKTAVNNWTEIDDEPVKIALHDPSENAGVNIFDKLGKFRDKFQIAQTATGWVDVMSLGVNKGATIKKIQQILNIKPDECMAFGDFLNDIEMFRAVGYGVAVENAHDDLKKIAKFETLSNDNFGVVVAIKKFIAENII